MGEEQSDLNPMAALLMCVEVDDFHVIEQHKELLTIFTLNNLKSMKTSTKIWMGITGVLLVILGVICIIYPGATLLSTSTVLGILTLASGISTFISWTRIKNYLPTGNMLLSSILQIILGIFFLNHKLLTASTLPIVFACWLLIEGIILSIRSFDFKDAEFKSWPVLLIFGIIAALIGLYSIIYPFDVAKAVMAYAIGIGIISLGIVDIVALFGVNNLEKRTFKWLNK